VLSAYTHLWNPIGFPTLRPDEGAYMRRAMHMLEGLGPQDPASRFDHSQDSTSSYDHPYFGQLFLAGIFKLIGYPSSILNISSSPFFSSPSSTFISSPHNVQHSIEMLYFVPRVLMGILAVVDTFLIYKICERRYNNKTIAFIASILFAVMPMTWILRLIVLDSIQLPFLLCSILFAIYYRYPIKRTDLAKENNIKKINSYNNDYALPKKSVMLILLSGIFLGLAIFTKIPAVTMIPLVGFLIYTNNENRNKNNLKKIFALWFIPVILIPLIWPIYSITVGQFDEWLKGVIWQGTGRHGGRTLADVMTSFFRIDPILLAFGTAGVVFSAVVGTRKNTDFLFFSLWLAPYLLLIYLVGWAIIFHLIVLLPAFCIAAARIIEHLVNRIVKDNRITKREKKELVYDTKRNVAVHRKLPLSSMLTLSSICVISVIAIFTIFGLTTTTILIRTNISFPQFEAAAFVAYDVEHNMHTNSNNNKNAANDDGGITIISSPIYSWIYNYVFHKSHVFSHDRDTQPIQTKKVILIVDGTYKRVLSKIEGEDEKQVRRLQMLYNSTETIAVFDDDTTRYVQTRYSNYYPYASMSENRIGGGGIEVRSNY
jgi:hypothetical protein